MSYVSYHIISNPRAYKRASLQQQQKDEGRPSDLREEVLFTVFHIFNYIALGLALSFAVLLFGRSTRIRVIGIAVAVNGAVKRAGENCLAALDFGVARLWSLHGSDIEVEDLVVVVQLALGVVVMLVRCNVGQHAKLGLAREWETKFHRHAAATGDLFLLLAKLVSSLLHGSGLGDNDLFGGAVVAAIHFDLDAPGVKEGLRNSNLDAALVASRKDVGDEVLPASSRAHQEINGGMQLSLFVGKLADESWEVDLGFHGRHSHLGKRRVQTVGGWLLLLL